MLETHHPPAHAPDDEASPPRVLVVPGIDGNTCVLEPVLPQLFPGMQALLFGHALDRAEGGIEGLAERALRLAESRWGEAPFYLCGESFGGPVALAIARRQPERIRGLLLFSTFARYPRGLGCYGGHVGLTAWRLLGDRAAACVLGAGRVVGVPGALGFRFSRQVARTFLLSQRLDMVAYRQKCQLALTFDARPWLEAITAPTLVLTGTWDPIVPPAAGRDLAALIPNARLQRLPGGHLVYAVRAAEVGRLVSAWRAELEGRLPAHAAA